MAYTSRIANQLLVTPFDDKCAVSDAVSDKLTEEEFCKYCYSSPKFLQQPQQYMPEGLNDESNDSPTNYEEIVTQRHLQEIAYDNFKLWLNNFSNCKIYTINGNAGTGKTTFINFMRYTSTDIKCIILDIHLARSYDEWIADVRTDVLRFEQAQSKVYGSIMNNLRDLIFKGTDEYDNYSLDIVHDRLKQLTDAYKEHFKSKYPSGRKLLDKVCEIMDSEQDIVIRVELSAKLFQQYVSGDVGEEGAGIIDVLNVFLLCLRCLSDNPEGKYIIVFDNFERFIAKDELYNKDVDRIRLLLTSYAKRINQTGNLHRNHFKFAMAVRDSTARMCGVRLHASDAEASNLDLGKWYDTQDIIGLKKKWYADNNMQVDNFDLVEQIIGDRRICTDQTITGLQLFIDPLFNDNKRLIIDFIGSMVELPGNAKNVQAYKALWDEDTSQSRFAARSIMRGMILDELEEKPDKLFEHLKTYSTRNTNNGVGDARKILTILYNNIYKGNDNEMPLVVVLSELFHRTDVEKIWNDEGNSGKRKSISEVLFYMNSYNRRENDWIQFIDLQFKNNNQDIVVENPDKLEQIISANMKNCTIHLMPAGKLYLMQIVASFEFFSLRYVPDYAPLFALVPTPDEIQQYSSIRQLPCYKKIEAVVKYAGQCISLLQHGEDTIRLKTGNAEAGKYHYMRIINQHKSYIETFVKYIQNKYCTSDKIDKAMRNKYEVLCRQINNQKNQYNYYEKGANKNLRR